MKLIFATLNENKAIELQKLMGNHIKVESLKELGFTEEIIESAHTLEGNSMLKADAVFDHFKRACFADDTGLEVDALAGAPGVRTARYAGENADSQANMSKLLGALADTDGEDRTARFRTVICLIRGGLVEYIEGVCEGSIVRKQSGAEGFGYDPVFSPEGVTVTFAEMSAAAKNERSHRGKAIRSMVSELLAKS